MALNEPEKKGLFKKMLWNTGKICPAFLAAGNPVICSWIELEICKLTKIQH